MVSLLHAIGKLKKTNPERPMYLLIKDAVKYHAPSLNESIAQEKLWTDQFIVECIEAYCRKDKDA